MRRVSFADGLDRGRELCTHSSIFSPNLVTLLPAASSIGLVRSTDSDSMQTLSVKIKIDNQLGVDDTRSAQTRDGPMLCASSNTTMLSLLSSFDTWSATFGSSR